MDRTPPPPTKTNPTTDRSASWPAPQPHPRKLQRPEAFFWGIFSEESIGLFMANSFFFSRCFRVFSEGSGCFHGKYRFFSRGSRKFYPGKRPLVFGVRVSMFQNPRRGTGGLRSLISLLALPFSDPTVTRPSSRSVGGGGEGFSVFF